MEEPEALISLRFLEPNITYPRNLDSSSALMTSKANTLSPNQMVPK